MGYRCSCNFSYPTSISLVFFLLAKVLTRNNITWPAACTCLDKNAWKKSCCCSASIWQCWALVAHVCWKYKLSSKSITKRTVKKFCVLKVPCKRNLRQLCASLRPTLSSSVGDPWHFGTIRIRMGIWIGGSVSLTNGSRRPKNWSGCGFGTLKNLHHSS